MTQGEEITLAIEHLEKAVDIFPDKDDEIRAYNDMLYAIISMLKVLKK
jgi:hypothetical protein